MCPHLRVKGLSMAFQMGWNQYVNSSTDQLHSHTVPPPLPAPRDAYSLSRARRMHCAYGSHALHKGKPIATTPHPALP